MNHSTTISENVTMTCMSTDSTFAAHQAAENRARPGSTIRITRMVATIIQAVSPLLGTGAGASAAAAGAAAAGRQQALRGPLQRRGR